MKALLQQALEALRQAAQKLTCIDTLSDCEAAIAALESELAQVVEPVNAEMLAALVSLVHNANGDAAIGYFNVPISSVINARAAIAKATGATP